MLSDLVYQASQSAQLSVPAQQIMRHQISADIRAESQPLAPAAWLVAKTRIQFLPLSVGRRSALADIVTSAALCRNPLTGEWIGQS